MELSHIFGKVAVDRKWLNSFTSTGEIELLSRRRSNGEAELDPDLAFDFSEWRVSCISDGVIGFSSGLCDGLTEGSSLNSEGGSSERNRVLQ